MEKVMCDGCKQYDCVCDFIMAEEVLSGERDDMPHHSAGTADMIRSGVIDTEDFLPPDEKWLKPPLREGDDEVDPPHEIVVRREYFDQDICPVCNDDGYECPACSDVRVVRGQKQDGYECPACSVISTERAENDVGRLICSVCGYVSGDVPKKPACIII